MKSNIACFISATNDFINKHGRDFNGQISFIITGDEEKKAVNGTIKMMEWSKKNNITFEVMFVGKFIPLHGIEMIVESARLLQKNFPR